MSGPANRRRLASSFVAATMLSCTATLPAGAHHSFAIFDGTRIVKITGTVTEFRWINPHASIRLAVSGDGAEPEGSWTVGMRAPTTLMAEGWARDSLTTGDPTTVFVNPLRQGVGSADARRGEYVGAILADGRRLGRVDSR